MVQLIQKGAMMFKGIVRRMGFVCVVWLFTIAAQAVELKPKGSVLFQDDFTGGRIGASWSVVEHRDPAYFRTARESVEGKDVWALQGLSEGQEVGKRRCSP